MEDIKRYELKVTVQKPFGNLYRKRHVLIFCVDSKNHILVGDKPDFYPKGITRMLGGGVDENEDITLAAIRELNEEIGISVKKNDLVPLAIVDTQATATNNEEFNLATYIFGVKIDETKATAGDDIKNIVTLTLNEFTKLIEKYKNLKEDFWFKNENTSHSWGDYGKVYSFIHEVALKEAVNKGLI